MVDFLLVGNKNAVFYKNIFPHIKFYNIRFGYNNVKLFLGGSYSCIWFTSLIVENRPYIKLKCYDKDKYMKFDRFDAINVDKLEDIPDYDGYMGVPITFLERWNMDQFDVIGLCNKGSWKLDIFRPIVNGIDKYARILIKKK